MTIYFLSIQNISCTIKILNEILNCIEYTFYDPDHLPIHKIINYFDLNSWQPTLWLILPITYYSLPPIITLDIWAFIILTTKQYGSRPHIFMKFFYVPSYLSYFITFDIIRDVSILAENSINLMITIFFILIISYVLNEYLRNPRLKLQSTEILNNGRN